MDGIFLMCRHQVPVELNATKCHNWTDDVRCFGCMEKVLNNSLWTCLCIYIYI